MVVMTGPEFGLRELNKAIRWEVAFQMLCKLGELDDVDAERRAIYKDPKPVRSISLMRLGWKP